jgi:hypothetical protein
MTTAHISAQSTDTTTYNTAVLRITLITSPLSTYTTRQQKKDFSAIPHTHSSPAPHTHPISPTTKHTPQKNPAARAATIHPMTKDLF